MLILTVVGARPQFVKAAAVSRALTEAGIAETLVHTGQHFDADMSDIFFAELGIPAPAVNLGIHGGSHGAMTGEMLAKLDALITERRPSCVLVYGDTNSTLAAALAAAKLHVPVAHVEAGLRSFNRAMPEEINRVLTDHVSALLFCPTHAAVANLAREGITKGVHHTGDVMFDATKDAASRAAAATGTVRDRLGLVAGSYAVATVHRAENTDDPAQLHRVMAWLTEQARTQQVVLPLHPRTKQAIARNGIATDALTIIPPVGYLDMAALLDGATGVFTDSGGVQKEAYFHGKSCVTLRSETEWVETIENGWNRLWTQPKYRPRQPITEYGTGQAARRIVELLVSTWG